MRPLVRIVMVLIIVVAGAANCRAQNNLPFARVKLAFADAEVFVIMYDNPASREFLARLPLTLIFEDYAGTEKISRLEQKLPSSGAPDGFEPAAGDFAYYTPWGNLAIFYKDFRYSSNLVLMRRFESDIEKLAAMQGDFTVMIEIVE